MFFFPSPTLFESCFITCVCEMIDESKALNHSTFAKKVAEVYPEFASGAGAPVKWRRIKNGSKSGKKQPLSMCEAYAMAEALGKTLPELTFNASMKMKQLTGGGPQQVFSEEEQRHLVGT